MQKVSDYLRQILILLVIGGINGCSSLLYFPMQPHAYDSSKIPFRHEDILFDSAAGPKLHGWYFFSTAPPAKATVLFLHGNGENLSTHFRSLVWLLKHEYDFFIIDYQGYGKSEGEPSPEGTVQDAIGAYRYLRGRFPARPIIFFGQSIGGAVALRAAIELKGEKMIPLVAVDSTFSSYKKVARYALRRHPLTWALQPFTYLVLSDSWAPDDRISEISPIPLVVIHGTHDKLVPYEMGREVFDLAKEPKEFWEVKEGHHIDCFWDEEGSYRERFLKKLREVAR